jgi:hypothetical protein
MGIGKAGSKIGRPGGNSELKGTIFQFSFIENADRNIIISRPSNFTTNAILNPDWTKNIPINVKASSTYRELSRSWSSGTADIELSVSNQTYLLDEIQEGSNPCDSSEVNTGSGNKTFSFSSGTQIIHRVNWDFPAVRTTCIQRQVITNLLIEFSGAKKSDIEIDESKIPINSNFELLKFGWLK